MKNFTSAKSKKRQSPQESSKVILMEETHPGSIIKGQVRVLKKQSNCVYMLWWCTEKGMEGRECERGGEDIIKYII